MARRADPERIFQARRAAIRNTLTGSGCRSGQPSVGATRGRSRPQDAACDGTAPTGTRVQRGSRPNEGRGGRRDDRAVLAGPELPLDARFGNRHRSPPRAAAGVRREGAPTLGARSSATLGERSGACRRGRSLSRTIAIETVLADSAKRPEPRHIGFVRCRPASTRWPDREARVRWAMSARSLRHLAAASPPRSCQSALCGRGSSANPASAVLTSATVAKMASIAGSSA